MRRLITFVASILAVGILASSPPTVSACSSDHPTFGEAVRGARAIARVTTIEGFDPFTDDPTMSETFRVERVLKGSLPDVVTVAPAWTALCHDTVGYYVGREDATIIVAFDVRYYDDTIHPMWGVDDASRIYGSAGIPPGVTTLAELEQAIVAAVGPPNTSTEPSTGDDSTPLLVLVAALTVLAASFRFGTARDQSSR